MALSTQALTRGQVSEDDLVRALQGMGETGLSILGNLFWEGGNYGADILQNPGEYLKVLSPETAAKNEKRREEKLKDLPHYGVSPETEDWQNSLIEAIAGSGPVQAGAKGVKSWAEKHPNAAEMAGDIASNPAVEQLLELTPLAGGYRSLVNAVEKVGEKAGKKLLEKGGKKAGKQMVVPKKEQGMFIGHKGAANLPKEVVDELPTSIDASGNKRWEISDESMRLSNAKPEPYRHGGGYTLPIGRAVEHPQLLQAYPGLAASLLSIHAGQPRSAYFDPRHKNIGLNVPHGGNELEWAMKNSHRGTGLKGIGGTQELDDLAHELQHWVDDREGYESGSSPQLLAPKSTPQFKAGIDRWNERMLQHDYPIDYLVTIPHLGGFDSSLDVQHELEAQMQWLVEKEKLTEGEGDGLFFDYFGNNRPGDLLIDPYDQYMTNSGEVRARNTTERRPLTLEDRRAIDPESTEDRPRSVQWSSTDPDPEDLRMSVGPPKKPPPAELVQALVEKPQVGLGRFPTTTPGRIVNKTKSQGGYTVNVNTGEVPVRGLMMGAFKNTDPRNTVLGPGEKLTPKVLTAHEKKVRKNLQGKDKLLGTWFDKNEGKTYIDTSQIFPEKELRKAVKFGERTRQKKGFNLGTMEEFPVGNWREFLEGTEFEGRVLEMGKIGRDYLKNHATREWWDMVGTPFERVYGKENLQYLAGFIASTAPNSAPIENLQVASEYMRRWLAGEPVLQPDWRITADSMSRKPGKMIGMEKTRRANLVHSGQGNIGALKQDKVREEAAALMGDPDAVVLDRHQVRLSEDPSMNIFANVKEGVLAPGKDYQALKAAIVKVANKVGRSARDYSADVWTGIRETIKNNSELYGTRFAGSAIRGESKSYADHFDDLIERKAKHLGISKDEMEDRLRKGSANLLSIILATPLGAAIFENYLESLGEGES